MHGGTKIASYGFTLAEVLITLGIIGIVAAMTLPALTYRKQTKELETSLKKNYSVIQQALEKLNYDKGETVKPADYPAQTFYKEFQKYFKVAYSCNSAGCVSSSTEELESGATGFYIKNYKTFNKSKNVVSSFFDDGQIVLLDGTTYLFENPAGDAEGINLFITVDVNGYKKKPNVWGHDLFTFQVLKNGKLLPMGAPETFFTDKNRYCSANSSENLNGIACTYSALTDKKYWNNLP